MATQGPLAPSVGESVTSGDANEVTWATPTNIQDADSDEATVTAATFDSPDPTFYLVGRGFGFTIPAGSTIDGITVTVNRRSIIASSGKTRLIRLRDAAGAEIGDDKNDIATIWPSSAATVTYGGAADTWNTGLSASALLDMVNDADFGVFLQAQANIANADIGVAWINVTIHYTPPATNDWTQPIDDAIAGVDAVGKAAGKVQDDAVGSADAAPGAQWDAARALDDTIAGADTQAMADSHPLADAASLTDQIAASILLAQAIDDAIQGTDALAKAPGHILADAIQGGDQLVQTWSALRALTDALGGTDVAASAVAKVLADALGAADQLSRSWTATQSIGDGLSLADLVDPQLSGGGGLAQGIYDVITVADAPDRTLSWNRLIADGLGIGDVVAFPGAGPFPIEDAGGAGLGAGEGLASATGVDAAVRVVSDS